MKNLKKLTAIGLAILVAFTIVGYQEVSADENNAGCFNVTNTTSGVTSTDGWTSSHYSVSSGLVSEISITKSGEYYIEQNCNCDTTNWHYGAITIKNAVDVTITLVNVVIKTTTTAIWIQNDDSNVTFILEGNNVISTTSDNTSAIMFTPTDNGSLTITSNDVAYLTVQGGDNSSGIGGGREGNGSHTIEIPGRIYITGYVNLSVSGGDGWYNRGNVDGYAIGTGNVLAENIEIEIHDCYYESEDGTDFSVTGSGCSINVSDSGKTLTTSATGPVASASPVESEDVNESPGYTSGLIIVDTASK